MSDIRRQMRLLAGQVQVEKDGPEYAFRQHALDLAEAVLTDAALDASAPPAVLRCGHCGRDLATEHGHALHVVFRDGSMRCWSELPGIGIGAEPVREYTITRAFLDDAARTAAIRALTEHGVTDDRFPGTTIYGKGGRDDG